MALTVYLVEGNRERLVLENFEWSEHLGSWLVDDSNKKVSPDLPFVWNGDICRWSGLGGFFFQRRLGGRFLCRNTRVTERHLGLCFHNLQKVIVDRVIKGTIFNRPMDRIYGLHITHS